MEAIVKCRFSLRSRQSPYGVKVDPDAQFRVAVAKLLAVAQLTLLGYSIYLPGQELGLINKKFTSIDEIRDVESLNLYQELCKTMTEGEALK